MIWDTEYWLQGPGSKVVDPVSGSKVLDPAGSWVLDPVFWIQGPGPGLLNRGPHMVLDPGSRIQHPGCKSQIQDPWSQTQDPELKQLTTLCIKLCIWYLNCKEAMAGVQ